MQHLINLQIPPPDLPDVVRFLAAADACTIESSEDSLDAQSIRSRINTQIRDLNEQRLTITRPMDDAKKLVMQLFDKPVSVLARALGIFDSKIIAWEKEQDRLRREAQRKLDERAAAERTRLQAIADNANAKGQTAKAETFEARAQQVVAPVVQSENARVPGLSLPKRWTFTIIDPKRIKPTFLVPDTIAIGKLVRSLGPKAIDLIGEGSVEIREEMSISSRRS
jgi:hypothetical protein